MAATTAAMGKKELTGLRFDCTSELYRAEPTRREELQGEPAGLMGGAYRLRNGNRISPHERLLRSPYRNLPIGATPGERDDART